jgi:hypothetical protein
MHSARQRALAEMRSLIEELKTEQELLLALASVSISRRGLLPSILRGFFRLPI